MSAWAIGLWAALSAPFCAAFAAAAANRAPLGEAAPQIKGAPVLALCGGAALLVAVSDAASAAVMLFVASALVYLSVFDLRAMAAPVAPLLAGVAAGLGWAMHQGVLADRLAASSIGLAAFLALDFGHRLLRGRSGLGAGDGLVAAFIGAWLGAEALAWSVALGASAAALLCLALRWPMTRPLAFVPALAAGVLFYTMAARLGGG